MARLNLRDKGVDLDTLICMVYEQVGEIVDHLVLSCLCIAPIWNLIARWWVVTLHVGESLLSRSAWAEKASLNLEMKKKFYALVCITMWHIWNFQNKLIFGAEKSRKDVHFDDILDMSYFWIKNRYRKGYSRLEQAPPERPGLGSATPNLVKSMNVISSDIFEAVKFFEKQSIINAERNASFITLVLKVKDPLYISDYTPLNLIDSIYKCRLCQEWHWYNH
ncbi:hypothetical protein LXL04_004562 [Taraxacum kok-saghyz]